MLEIQAIFDIFNFQYYYQFHNINEWFCEDKICVSVHVILTNKHEQNTKSELVQNVPEAELVQQMKSSLLNKKQESATNVSEKNAKRIHND